MPATIHSLPEEILPLITTYLDAIDLSSFSQTSQRHELASRCHVFGTVHVKLPLPDDDDADDRENTDLAKWTALLSKRNAHRHVRRLVISDARRHHEAFDSASQCEHLPFELFPRDRTDYTRLLEVVGELGAMRDVVWRCKRQVPPVLLQALEDRMSGSGGVMRLHHETFRLRRRLGNAGESVPEAIRYEWKIATSPVLYRIVVRCCESGRGETNCSIDGLFALVQHGLAPHLKEVVMLEQCLSTQWGLHPNQMLAALAATQHNTSHDAAGIPSQERTQGGLTLLHLHGFMRRESHSIVENGFLPTRTAFLKELSIDASVNTHALAFLACQDWSCLRILRLRNPPRRAARRWSSFQLEFATFLNQIKELRELELLGGMTWELLEPALLQNAATLRSLLVPCLVIRRPEDLLSLRRRCLRLSELSIATQRTQGDGLEFELYGALGEFRNLEHLDLLLDCSTSFATTQKLQGDNGPAWTVQGLLHGDDFQRDRDGRLVNCILQAWTNADMVKDMAATIFSAAADSKPAISIPLQTLNLRLRKEGEVADMDIANARRLVNLMDRDGPRKHIAGVSWHCRRQVVDGIAGCVVTELVEHEDDKKSNVEDNSPRGLDIRPLILPSR